MVNQAKKNKKTPTNNKKSIIILFFTVLIALLGFGAYAKHASEADKDNVITMRDSAAKLVSRIKTADQHLAWVDNSQCVISRSSSFGEDVAYSCDTHYIHTSSVASQQEIDRLISVVTTILNDSSDIISNVSDNSTGRVSITDATNENSYYNATSFIFNDVRLDKGSCYVRYVISEVKDNIEVSIECTVGTKKAYFEPIIQT